MNSSAQLPFLVTNAHQRGCGTRSSTLRNSVCLLQRQVRGHIRAGTWLYLPFPNPATLTEVSWCSTEGISFCTEIAVSQNGEPMWRFLFAHPLLNFCSLTSHWNLPLGTILKNGQQEIRVTAFSLQGPPLGGPISQILQGKPSPHPFLPSSISTSLILPLGSEWLSIPLPAMEWPSTLLVELL